MSLVFVLDPGDALASTGCIVNGGTDAYRKYFETGAGNNHPNPVQEECLRQIGTGGCFSAHPDGCYFESGACPGGKCYGLNVGVFGPCGDISTDVQTQFDFTAQLHNCQASGRDLRRVRIDGVDAWGADFSGADVTGASMRGTDIRMMNLRDARARNVMVHNAVACNVNSSGSESQWPDFTGAKITDSMSGLFNCRKEDGSNVQRVRRTCSLVLDHYAVWSDNDDDDGTAHRTECSLEAAGGNKSAPEGRGVSDLDATETSAPPLGAAGTKRLDTEDVDRGE